MTIEEARKKIIRDIRDIYDKNEAHSIAELLMENITKLTKTERLVDKDRTLSTQQEELVKRSVERLQDHEPVQYVTSEAWFAGMKFYVDKNVLIPRPETEELLDWVVKDLRSKSSDVRILDVGTGSGCIAIALKMCLPDAEVWACDISREALNMARINADLLTAAVDFVLLDFLNREQRSLIPYVDIIVSNPPYILEKDRKELGKNVSDYEPEIALFVPDDDPWVFYSEIADFGRDKLNAYGNIYVEIHEDIDQEVEKIFRLKGYRLFELKKDLQGKERMMKISLR